MLKNYLKIALRNIRRHKGYSFINLAGLSVGLAACILSLIWVRDELNYDRFHTNIDHLYRALEHERMSDDKEFIFPLFPPPFGPALKKDYPQVLDTVRTRSMRGRLFRVGDRSFYEDRVLFADSSLLTVFSFPLISGDPGTALSSPSSIVLTEKTAEKYFPGEDPLGRMIQVDGAYEYRVTGVVKNIPAQSTLKFDFVIPFVNLEKYDYDMNDWGTYGITTAILLDKKVDAEAFDKEIEGYLKKNSPETIMTVSLQPFKDIHLHSAGISSSGTDGDIRSVTVFSLIALFILFMACVNFMNLTTACSENRAREVGLRKVVGAGRRNLLVQFFGESILLSFIALVFAVAIAQLVLKAFNNLTGKEMTFHLFTEPGLLLTFFVIALFTGLVAGIYPALFLSSFQPLTALRKKTRSGTGGGLFRKILVVFQFALTICLIVGTVIANRQMHFIRNLDLGIDKEHVMSIPLKGGLKESQAFLKTELLRQPSVLSVTAASDPPAGNRWSMSMDNWEGRDTEVNALMDLIAADSDYLNVFGIELLNGRFFRENEPEAEE
ncbi:MAG: ABC transporter permease, partial [Candidatus Aminicenantes bacterium]|nr:ABC transporter permease [Candidatus Aminicenantes bacterium]